MTQYFEKAKFCSIIQYYLNSFCGMESQLELLQRDNNENQNVEESINSLIKTLQTIPQNDPLPQMLRRNMRLFITEFIPSIHVSDGHNFIEAIFTKEAINEFRKYYSHVRFSSLKDKIIYISKWKLEISGADSKKLFNSYQNLSIKLVIEQFKPKMHETLKANFTNQATSIFRNPEVQMYIRNFRHWFTQKLICKNAITIGQAKAKNIPNQSNHANSNVEQEQDILQHQIEFLPMPNLTEILGNNDQTGSVKAQSARKNNGKAQISSQSGSNKKRNNGYGDSQQALNTHNSQITTQFSDNDQSQDINTGQLNFGGIIQKTQVFRCKKEDFDNVEDLKIDCELDLPDFQQQVQIAKSFQSKDLKIADVDRIVIQEKGEQYYAERKYKKSRYWEDMAEDEYLRNELRIQIEYFQVCVKQKEQIHYESQWQRKEREKASRQSTSCASFNRRIVGYTLGHSALQIKEKLIRLLNTSKRNLGEKIIPRDPSHEKPMGRPRANSQENILQIKDQEDEKTQMFDSKHFKPKGLSREPLSQFVTHHQPISVYNDDTQSEQDSVEDQIDAQLAQEREAANKIDAVDQIMDFTQPLLDSSISLFREYLKWMNHDNHNIKQNAAFFPQQPAKQDHAGGQDDDMTESIDENQEEDEPAPQWQHRYSTRHKNKLNKPVIDKEDEEDEADEADEEMVEEPKKEEYVPFQDKLKCEGNEKQNSLGGQDYTNSNNQYTNFDNVEKLFDKEDDQQNQSDHEIKDHNNHNVNNQYSNDNNQDYQVYNDFIGQQNHQQDMTDNNYQNSIDIYNQNQPAEQHIQDKSQQNQLNSLKDQQVESLEQMFDEQINILSQPQSQIDVDKLILVTQENSTPSPNFAQLEQESELILQSIEKEPSHCQQPMLIDQISKSPQQHHYESASKQMDDKLNYTTMSSHKSPELNKIETLSPDQKSPIIDKVFEQQNLPAVYSTEKKSQESEKKPILDVEFKSEPKKPLNEMSAGERAFFEIEAQMQLLTQEMEAHQKKLQLMADLKIKAQQKLKEEADKEKERLEQERLQKLEEERIKREYDEELKRQQEEKMRQERIQSQKNQILNHIAKILKSLYDNKLNQIIEEQKIMAEKERIRLEEENRLKQIEIQKQKQIELQKQKKIEEEQKEKDRIRQIQIQQEKQKAEQLELENQRQKTIELEKEKHRQFILEQMKQTEVDKIKEQRIQQQTMTQSIYNNNLFEIEQEQDTFAQPNINIQSHQDNEDELDWEEGNDQQEQSSETGRQVDNSNNESSFNIQEMDQQKAVQDYSRQQYINDMTQKFEGVLCKEIKRNVVHDFKRRQIKGNKNDDKLFDFMKIDKLRNEKYGLSSDLINSDGKKINKQINSQIEQSLQDQNYEIDADQLDAKYLQKADYLQSDEKDENYFNSVFDDQSNGNSIGNASPEKEQMSSSQQINENIPAQQNNKYMEEKDEDGTQSLSDMEDEDSSFHQTISDVNTSSKYNSEYNEVTQNMAEQKEKNKNQDSRAQDNKSQQLINSDQNQTQLMSDNHVTNTGLQTPPSKQIHNSYQNQTQMTNNQQNENQIGMLPMNNNVDQMNQMQVPMIQSPFDTNANGMMPADPKSMMMIQSLQAQVSALSQQLGMIVNNIQLSSQNQLKQGGNAGGEIVQNQNKIQTEKQEEDSQQVDAPYFGSKMKSDDQTKNTTKDANTTQEKGVKPFNLNQNKRNYTEMANGQQRILNQASMTNQNYQEQYDQHNREASQKGKPQNQYSSLQEFVDQRRLETHKKHIQGEYTKRDQKLRRQQEAKRQSINETTNPNNGSGSQSMGQKVQQQVRQGQMHQSNNSNEQPIQRPMRTQTQNPQQRQINHHPNSQLPPNGHSQQPNGPQVQQRIRGGSRDRVLENPQQRQVHSQERLQVPQRNRSSSQSRPMNGNLTHSQHNQQSPSRTPNLHPQFRNQLSPGNNQQQIVANQRKNQGHHPHMSQQHVQHSPSRQGQRIQNANIQQNRVSQQQHMGQSQVGMKQSNANGMLMSNGQMMGGNKRYIHSQQQVPSQSNKEQQHHKGGEIQKMYNNHSGIISQQIHGGDQMTIKRNISPKKQLLYSPSSMQQHQHMQIKQNMQQNQHQQMKQMRPMGRNNNSFNNSANPQ